MDSSKRDEIYQAITRARERFDRHVADGSLPRATDHDFAAYLVGSLRGAGFQIVRKRKTREPEGVFVTG